MKFLELIREKLFPDNLTCCICGKEIFSGDWLCGDCRAKLPLNNGACCPLCGRRTYSEELCLECKDRAPLYAKAVSALVYEGEGKKLVYSFKTGKPYLKRRLAKLICDKCEPFADADGVCYVPMRSREEHKRGYNQAKLLAAELAEMLKLPLIKDAVEKTGKTPPQKSLGRADREQNLKGCFKADRQKVGGKTLILVDDVMTTGATADAVCGELLKRGAKKVYFATVASVEYKNPL